MDSAKAGARWLVPLLFVALAVNYVDRQMVYSIFPALKSDLGFSDSQLGLVGSVFAWVYSLCMPFAGKVADRYSRKRLIVSSMVLWSAATLGCGFSGSVPVFLVWRAVMGITESLYYPAAVGLIAAAHLGATRSRALGIHQSAQFAGLVAGGWYGGWMADHWSWRNGFTMAAVVGIAYAAILALALRTAKNTETKPSTERGSFAELAGSQSYLALALAFFAFCSMLWVFYAWYPLFLVERHGLTMTESGFNATIFLQSACGLGVIAGGTIADKLSKTHPAARVFVAAAGIVLSAPFGYLTFAADTLTMTRIYSGLYGVFSGLMIANVFAAACDVTPARSYSFGAGVLNMVGGISSAAMIFLAGIWKQSIGFPGMMRGVALFCMTAAVVLAIVGTRRFVTERERALAAA